MNIIGDDYQTGWLNDPYFAEKTTRHKECQHLQVLLNLSAQLQNLGLIF